MTPPSIEIPQGREDLQEKIAKLYQGMPKEAASIIEWLQSKYQFTNTDEYLFRERVIHAIEETAFAVVSSNSSITFQNWYKLNRCIKFTCDWLEITEMGLSESVKLKIMEEEECSIYNDIFLIDVTEMCQRNVPKGVAYIIERLSLKYQFCYSDEQTFRDRVRHEIKEAVFEIKNKHSIPSATFWRELIDCTWSIGVWLREIELGLSNDINIKQKIIKAEEYKIFVNDLREINEINIIQRSTTIPSSIKIPKGREDLKAKLIELYRRTLPEEVLNIVERVQLRHQFSSTDEYSFRDRVEYEMREAILEIKSNHFSLLPKCLYEIDTCLGFILDWLGMTELGLSEDTKRKIISEESRIIVDDFDLRIDDNNENYEVVRNLEVFQSGTNKLIFNKYVYTRL